MRLSGGRLALVWAHLRARGLAATWNEMVLTFTADLDASTSFSIQTGAPGSATTDGDIFTLHDTAAEFNDDGMVAVHRNGLLLHKGVDVSWSSTTQLVFPIKLKAGDVIQIERITL